MPLNEWEAAAAATVPATGSEATALPSAVDLKGKASAPTSDRRRAQWQQDAQQQHRQSLRGVAESLQLARETAHMLSMQSEQLSRNERAVEEAQYAVYLSKRIMRGMTWSGWIANAFSAPPQLESKDTAASNGSSSKPDGEIAMGFICPECKIKFTKMEELATHYAKVHEPSAPGANAVASGDVTMSSVRSGRQAVQDKEHNGDIHEQFLRDLEPQLSELKEASLALGNALDTQNAQLDRMDDKVERMHDGLKRVSVQAKKLAGKRMPVVFRFRCSFQELQTRKFVQDMNGEPILGAEILGDGCTFRAYTLGDDTEIWGFQSETSSFFLGINRYGNLKVRGGDLQSYEQLAIEVGHETTTLFVFASYFGYGAWVVRKDEDKLSLVRGTPENKVNAARFKLINLDEIKATSAADR